MGLLAVKVHSRLGLRLLLSQLLTHFHAFETKLENISWTDSSEWIARWILPKSIPVYIRYYSYTQDLDTGLHYTALILEWWEELMETCMHCLTHKKKPQIIFFNLGGKIYMYCEWHLKGFRWKHLVEAWSHTDGLFLSAWHSRSLQKCPTSLCAHSLHIRELLFEYWHLERIPCWLNHAKYCVSFVSHTWTWLTVVVVIRLCCAQLLGCSVTALLALIPLSRASSCNGYLWKYGCDD